MAKRDLKGSLDGLFGGDSTAAPTPKKTADTPLAPPVSEEKTETKIEEAAKEENVSLEKPKVQKKISEPKSKGKPKVLPDTFKRTSYILDEDVIKKFKVIATLKGESINLLLNDLMADYVKKNFDKLT